MRQTVPVPAVSRVALPGCSIFSASLNAILQLDEVVKFRPAPWTLLVPTDEALAGLSTEAMNDLVDSSQPLAKLIRTHLVHGMLTSRDMAGEGWLVTLEGDYLPVDVFGALVLIDGAQVLHADLRLTCGIAHVIDRVLIGAAQR